MALDSNQEGRIARAREVAAGRRQPGKDTADVIHGLSVENGQLRYWLNDMLDLVGELAKVTP